MGLLNIFTGRSSVKPPAARERLFALSTAYVTLETSYEIVTAGVAGIAVQALATADFTAMLKDTEEVVTATAGDLSSKVETRDDDYGFRWVIVRTDKIEDLVVQINGVSSSVEAASFNEKTAQSRRSPYPAASTELETPLIATTRSSILSVRTITQRKP